MAHTSLTCPSCSAVLKVPDTIPAGAALKCPKCATRFRRGTTVIAAPAASDFWETVQLDDLYGPAPTKTPPTPGAVSKAKSTPGSGAASPKPKAVPLAARIPAAKRGLMTPITTGAIGLSCGLIVALVIAITHRTSAESPKDAGQHVDATPIPPSKSPDPPPSPPATVVRKDSPKEDPKKQGPPAWAFENWLQDPVAAQAKAKEQKKRGLLLLLDASDWSEPSKSLANEVFAQQALWERLTALYVPVHIDFPSYPTANERVQDRNRNTQIQARYFKHPAYPRVILTDTEGRPFALEDGYEKGTAQSYVTRVETAAQKLVDRDILLAAVTQADGAAKLPAARKSIEYLVAQVEGPTGRGDGTYIINLRDFYAVQLLEWRRLADTYDPNNTDGHREFFFWHDWMRRGNVAFADEKSDAKVLRELADEFANWSKGCQLREDHCGVSLLARQAEILGRLNDSAGREKAIDEALKLKPSPNWQKALADMRGSGRASAGASFGTGFAVAPNHIVTNYHVVRGMKTISIKLAKNADQTVSATVAAHSSDPDLALLKVDLPAGVTLTPLRVAPLAPIAQATPVATLGYALGAKGTKFTQGAVSERSAEQNRPTFLYLDQRVNPGNSGGPLFDASGNIVGVMWAKSIASGPIDSYGVAYGADTLDKFLRENLPKEYKAATPMRGNVDWTKLVESRISQSVVQVIGHP